MSDLDILIVTFQTQLSGLMETVLKTAMYEVTRLVEDGLMEEVRRRSQEVESLRTQLQWAERKLNDDGLVKREHKGRCVNCGAADVNVSFDVAEERPTNVHYSVLKRCDLKEEGNTAEGCSPEVVFEATGSGELTPALSPAKESPDVEEDRVKIEDFDKSFCAVHLGGWGVGHDGETGANSISQNEVANTGTEQKHRNSEESLPTTIKQDLLTGATHTFNEDQGDVCTQYAQVLAEPTQISPSESKMAALALRRADAGLSQHYTAGTLEQECEPTLTKSSPKQMVHQLLDTASVWPQGRNLSSSSKSSVEGWGQTSQVGDVVIKQEFIVDSDEDEEEDEERLDEEETVPVSVSSFSESEYMLRPEALKQNITHDPPGQEAQRLHAKVSANVTLQAGVQHCSRPIKNTCHTLTASAATAHSHVRHFNLNRTPSTSKLALPASVAALSRPGLPWISTRTHHGTSSPLHQVSHLPGARHLLRCGQCGKGFPHPSNLKAHLKTHTGERPFGCSLCGRSFTKLSNLKAHRRVHTGERPYCCSACGKRFTQKCNLKRHQRIHLDT